MGDCPDPECREHIKTFMSEIKKTMFGPDGLGGLTGCMKKFVTKKQLWLSIPLFIVIIGSSYTILERYIFATKTEAFEREKRITVIEKGMARVTDIQAELTREIAALKLARDNDTINILNAIKDLGWQIEREHKNEAGRHP